MVTVLDDRAVEQVSPRTAVQWMADAVDRHARGQLDAPARFGPALPSGRLTFTLGGCRQEPSVVGFRVYDLDQIGTETRDEATLVFSSDDGRLLGIVVGRQLGALRTGAIGGVAADTLALPDADEIGLIGTGRQAWTQLLAVSAVRAPRRVRVYGRDAARRAAFVHRACARGLPAQGVASAEEAVRGASIVLTVTDSPRPVLEAAWLAPGCHINHVGPNFKDAQEISADVAARAHWLVTDSLAQREAFGERFSLAGTALDEQLLELGALRVRGFERAPTDISLFFSLGLAGTEVLMATHLLALLDSGHT